MKIREKSRVCDMCGDICKPVEHHLVFGSGLRDLADEDDLVLDLCIDCHTLAFRVIDRIHDNVAAERLSKMLGQVMYERNVLAEVFSATPEEAKENILGAREAFRNRYGRSYL